MKERLTTYHCGKAVIKDKSNVRSYGEVSGV